MKNTNTQQPQKEMEKICNNTKKQNQKKHNVKKNGNKKNYYKKATMVWVITKKQNFKKTKTQQQQKTREKKN